MREEGSLFLQRNKYFCLCGVWRIKSVKACCWPFQCINRVLRRGSQTLLDICPTYIKFSFFRSNWNKRTTSKRSPQFWNGFSGKLVYLLLSTQNNWLNGKHPWNSHINSVTATERLCNSRVKSVIIYAFTVWKWNDWDAKSSKFFISTPREESFRTGDRRYFKWRDGLTNGKEVRVKMRRNKDGYAFGMFYEQIKTDIVQHKDKWLGGKMMGLQHVKQNSGQRGWRGDKFFVLLNFLDSHNIKANAIFSYLDTPINVFRVIFEICE